MVTQSPKRVDAAPAGEAVAEGLDGAGKSLPGGMADRRRVRPPPTRQSSRIRALEMARKECLGRGREELVDEEDDDHLSKKKKKVVMRRRRPVVGQADTEEDRQAFAFPTGEGTSNAEKSDYVKTKENLCIKAFGGCQDGKNVAVADESIPANVAEKTDCAKVKETLRLFNKYYLYAVQEEEKRCFVNRKNRAKGSKKEMLSGKDKKKAKRPDLKAVTMMKDTNTLLHPHKRLGNIPGIKVGHQFYSRAEMVVLGFHTHWLFGIDFMVETDYKNVHKNLRFPLACSVVLSGMYEDDLDKADEIIYTGQGGHNLTGDKRQIGDQKMKRGNLGLKHCCEQDVSVRVIRGHKCRHSYTGKIYTYDGLYKVVRYRAEKGVSGFIVYKFLLRRVEGQPMLTTNQVRFFNGRVPESLSDLRGMVCEDIAEGQENFPIPVTNIVDEPPIAPSGFKYISSNQVAENVTFPKPGMGCNCKGTCVDSEICACAQMNGFNFPYVQDGRLIVPKDVVYECGPNCGCGPACINRASQRGLKYHLEVFRAPRKGWAVRSWDFIPSGGVVCEYIGILKRSEDVEGGSENSYIFDIDCIQTMKGLEGRERRSRNPPSEAMNQVDSCEDPRHDVPEYCIDAGSSGNIARFINHSCEPNLYVQCVLTSHRDMRFARVVLIAADNIPPLQELTYDYGYALDSVIGPDGKVKQMLCFCGAQNCRRRMF